MKIVFMEWNSIGSLDMRQALTTAGHTIIPCPFHVKVGRYNTEWEESFSKTLRVIHPDIVFSFNYFPIISTVCNRERILYYSWVYDSPLHTLYSKTVYNPCNRIFIFDRELANTFRDLHITTINYLPLAVNVSRFNTLLADSHATAPYQCDVSFVGSLYTEEKYRLFKHFETLPDYVQGYLGGLIEVQKNVYGSTIIKEALSDEIIAQMQKAVPVKPHIDGFETAADIYTDYYLLREVTTRDRLENLTELGQNLGSQYQINLYTRQTALTFPGISLHREVSYYNEMPYVFMGSKINLNMTNRSTISGIPLRALDILGCGGFLLSNYQADFFDFLEPDTDFVYYESRKDMLDKIAYYLKHDDERKEIAKNGYLKVCENFDYHTLIEKMFAV